MRRFIRSRRPFALIVVIAALAIGTAWAADTATKSTTKPAAAKPAAATATKSTAADPSAIKTDPAHDAAMAEMMKFAMPGPSHDKLKAFEGSWKAVTKSWFAPGEPTVTEGVSTNRMILGGRYVLQEFKGTMMGQPFEGLGLTGYDNRKGVYTMVWLDNMTTATMTGEGSMDAAGKAITLKSMGEGMDGKPTPFTLVTTMVDANTHVFTMSAPIEGKDTKMMEITYTRQ